MCVNVYVCVCVSSVVYMRGPRVSLVLVVPQIFVRTYVKCVDSSRSLFSVSGEGARFIDHRHDFAATSKRANFPRD